MSEKQNKYFEPSQINKEKSKLEIRDLKLNLLINQLRLMIEQSGQDQSEPDPTAVLAPRPIWSTSIGRFRGTLSGREVAFMQMCAHGKMIRYGYQLEPQHLSWSSRLFFYSIDYPVNLTRMLLSRSQSNIRDRIGRMPSARRLALAS